MPKKVWTAAARKAFAEKMRTARAAKGDKRKRRANPGRSYHNIEKLPGKDYYTGYADGPWEIRKSNSSYGNWIARKKSDPTKTLYAFGLKSMSEKLEALNRPTHSNPGRAAVHTKKFDRTVRKVKKSLRKYHRKGNAYAVASKALGEKRSILKRHRRKNTAGVVILVKGAGKTYYFTRDKKLMAGAESNAHRYKSVTHARHMAQSIARGVPHGYRVAIHKA